MGEVKIRRRARQVRRKGIGQAASDQTDVLVAIDENPTRDAAEVMSRDFENV
jgi:hypothetical protein